MGKRLNPNNSHKKNSKRKVTFCCQFLMNQYDKVQSRLKYWPHLHLQRKWKVWLLFRKTQMIRLNLLNGWDLEASAKFIYAIRNKGKTSINMPAGLSKLIKLSMLKKLKYRSQLWFFANAHKLSTIISLTFTTKKYICL